MERYVIIVPPDMEDTCLELSQALAGQDVSVILERRSGERRQGASARTVDRRRKQRRGARPSATIRSSTQASSGSAGTAAFY
jgi:hypothetical protein